MAGSLESIKARYITGRIESEVRGGKRTKVGQVSVTAFIVMIVWKDTQEMNAYHRPVWMTWE